MTEQSDWNTQFQANLEAMRVRMEDHFENQARLNADLRTRQATQSQQLDQLVDLAEITLNSIVALRDEFRQHRSDNHGA